ncbi:MAG: hypothetical protein GEV13_30530 [Rhodospirillales bacterium]|nr:hypothetical protein [Rhodospirillales bacterium]
MSNLRLQPIQALPTSGARAALPFVLEGRLCLALPQLAKDIPGRPADMNGGNSDIAMPILRWEAGRFAPWRTLSVPGGEDAEHFEIGGRAFLATASIRTGQGPYEYNARSTLWAWRDGDFAVHQEFDTFAAKQWRHFAIGGRHFLALAQGVVMPGLQARHDGRSTIFEWDGERFVPFQAIASSWGYNWHAFRHADVDYLAYADHHSPSVLLRWTGSAFEPAQTFDGTSGRAFATFEAGGEHYLVFARLTDDSLLYRWQGGRLVVAQTLPGAGARELASVDWGGERLLVVVRFITGTRQAPKAQLDSVVWRLRDGALHAVATVPTSGATDAAIFVEGGETFLVVSESLAPDVRFRTDSHVYRLGNARREEQP